MKMGIGVGFPIVGCLSAGTITLLARSILSQVRDARRERVQASAADGYAGMTLDVSRFDVAAYPNVEAAYQAWRRHQSRLRAAPTSFDLDIDVFVETEQRAHSRHR
jgi:hypothetical protein